MFKKLQEIAEVRSGYTFRGAFNHQRDGDIFVIQAKDLKIDNESLKIGDLQKVGSDSLRNPFFLQYNDILIVSRGTGAGSFRSTVFTSEKENIIASSSVYIIRVKGLDVLPKYLSLYLNSNEGQKKIMETIIGSSYVQSIVIKNLINLSIPIPSIDKQKTIIELSENIKEQEKIIIRKKQLKENILNSVFINQTNK